MRILAIRGANLASLAKFEIDLSTEPLAGAGLFAITGDTGAGKSTILDALCLAFYGEYPRAAIGRREDAPDPSGEVLSVTDARNILRRGEASAYAEADFIGQDGHAYRVRWEARRARGKADGKPQSVDRRLDRLDGSAAVASGIKPVLEAVVDKTGLTFEQFRRTVLLAQGEFDAFLLADEKTRAELLEKITGTDVYRRISQGVHAGMGARAHDVATREAARGAIGLLDPSARDAHNLTITNAQRTALDTTAARDALAKTLAVAQQQRQAGQRVAAAEAFVQSAKQATVAAAPDQARVALHARLLPLGALGDQVRQSERQSEAAATAATAMANNALEAQQAQLAATKVLQKALHAENTAKLEFTAADPQWREAEALDTRLATAQREHAAAETQATGVLAAAAAAVADGATIAAEILVARQAHAQLTAQQTNHAAHALLADRADDLTTLIAKRTALQTQHRTAERAADTAKAEAQRWSKIDATERDAIAAADQRRKSVTETLSARKAALAAAGVPAAEARDRALGQLLEALREAETLANAWDRAGGEMALARTAATEAQDSLAETGKQLRLAEADNLRITVARKDIGVIAELAAATASEHATALRGALTKGEPCPVCGSLAHPFMAKGGAGERLMLEIAGRRDRLDADLVGITKRLTELRGTEASGRAAFDAAQRQGTAAEAEHTQLAKRYSVLAGPLTVSLTASGLAHQVPPVINLRTIQALAVTATDAAKVRTEYSATLAQIEILRADIESLQAEHDTLTAQRETALSQQSAAALERAQADARLLATTTTQTQIAAAVAEATAAVLPYLACSDVTPEDLNRDAAAATARLLHLGAEYRNRARALAHYQTEQQALSLREATLSATQAAAAVAAKLAADTIASRAAARDVLAKARALVLGGADTATHRDAITNRRDAAQSARAKAADMQQRLAFEHIACDTRREAAAAAASLATERVATARTEFANALLSYGVSATEALEALDITSAVLAVLNAQIDALVRAETEAAAALALRKDDLAALTVAGAVTIDEAAAQSSLATLQDEINGLSAVISDAKAKLALDDAGRIKAGALGAEIDTARADLGIWQEVNAAIGSAEGDKFRRFAQGITLDHLVQLANLQLAALNPRYRLARNAGGGLGLSVLDRDMGEELRAVRSLSGGERFLVSLALALALSGLEGRQSFVDTLFIDEGFGSLDAETLDMAIDALETLQSHGRKVGVITHVAAMMDRIAVQIRVVKRGQGRSIVQITTGEPIAA